MKPRTLSTKENERIQFVCERDGIDAALQWARQTLHIYRKCLADRGNANRRPHFARSREYRHGFLSSVAALAVFIRTNAGRTEAR